jgi:ketosteroid isomerase-like protein
VNDDATEARLLELDQVGAPEGSAAVAPDVEAMDALYSADFVLHAPNGTVMERQTVLEAARRGARRESFWYDAYARTTEYVRALGDVAITMGSETVVPGAGPDAGKTVHRRFTHLYRKENDAWKLLVRHANPTRSDR